MLNRFATLAAVCVLNPVWLAPLAMADPPPDPDAGAPPITGAVASEVPGIAHTQDGRTLTVSAKDETELPVAPLTTALSSRDWMVGGTFMGQVTGSVNGGSLEAGYQIGCGIAMDKIKLDGSLGVSTGSNSLNGFGVLTFASTLTFPIQGVIEVEPRPARSSTFRWTRGPSRARTRASRSTVFTSRSTTASARRRFGRTRC